MINIEENVMGHPNTKYKDSLFRRVFGAEDKRSARWRLELYNALSGKNHNEGLHKSCKALYDYCSFIDRIKSNIKEGIEKEAAIDEAIDWAVKENLLEGFIKEQRAEVRMDLLTEFDQEQYDRIRRREGYQDGVTDGITQGAQQNAIKTALAFLKEGDSPEKIARCTELPLEKVLELQEQITEKA